MDCITIFHPPIRSNSDRIHRVSSWISKPHCPSSTTATVNACPRASEYGWEEDSTTSSMEAQIDVEDLHARNDLMTGEDKSKASEVELLGPAKPRAEVDELLITYMGSGLGDVDTDNCHIIIEPEELLIDDNANKVHSSSRLSNNSLWGVGSEIELYQSSCRPEPCEIETSGGEFVKSDWPCPERRADFDSWSDIMAPSLLATTRSTITSVHPATPPSHEEEAQLRQWIGNDALQCEEPLPVANLEHLVYGPDTARAITERRPLEASNDRESLLKATPVLGEDKAQPNNEKTDNYSHIVVPNKPPFDVFFQILADGSDWRVHVEGLRPPLIHLPPNHVYFQKRESVLDSLESEFRQSHPGQGSSTKKAVSFKSPTSYGTVEGTSQALGKRPLRDDEDENEGSPFPPPKKKPRDREPYSRYLACPYFKKNIVKYDACVRYSLNDIKAVKQHLERKHQGPQFYCPTCFQEFETQSESDAHVRARTCHEGTQDDENMSADKAREIGTIAASRKRMAEEERWFRIFEVLFPGSQRPSSAYIARGHMEALSHISVFMTGHRGHHIINTFFHEIGDLVYRGVSPENLHDDLAIRLVRRIFFEYNEELENPPRRNIRSSNSNFSNSTSVDRSSFPVTTNATSVDDDDRLNASHTLPSASEEAFCFDEGQIDAAPQWDQGEPPFPPIDLSSYSPLLSGTAERFDIDALLVDVQGNEDRALNNINPVKDDENNA